MALAAGNRARHPFAPPCIRHEPCPSLLEISVAIAPRAARTLMGVGVLKGGALNNTRLLLCAARKGDQAVRGVRIQSPALAQSVASALTMSSH
jgi:hypothetical protein